MTLRMYANLQEAPPGGGPRPPPPRRRSTPWTAPSCETKVGKIDRIEREIEVLGALTEEQRLRLLEIADKLPGPPDADLGDRRSSAG